MRRIGVFMACLMMMMMTGEVKAEDFHEAQRAWIYLGRVNHEKGIRLLSPQENLIARKGGRWCRRTNKTRPRLLTFDVADSFFEGNPPRVEVRVEYFDGGKDTFATVARTLEGRYRVGRIIEKEGSESWRTYTASLSYPHFGAREDRFEIPDLAINNRWDGDEFIRTVQVKIPYLHPETEALGNLFSPGNPITLFVKLFKRGKPENFMLLWEIKDWRGRNIGSGEDGLAAKPGFFLVKQMNLSGLPLGAYQVTFTLKQKEHWVEQAVLHFAVAEPVTLKDPLNSPFGVCTQFMTPFAKDKAKLLKDSGIFWMRQVIRGDQIYAGGNPDWERTDKAVAAAQKEGLHVLGTLLSAPPGTGDFSTDESRKAFAAYAAEVVERYPSIRHWEIWNEPDTIGFWGDRDWGRYLALMKEVYPRIKKVDPSSLVMNGGLTVGNYWFLGELYQGGIKNFLDRVAIHPYADDPEEGIWSLGMKIEAARSNILTHDPGRKLWLTEIGWNTAEPGGASLEEQAAILTKTMVIALSYPEVERIFWFTFDNLGEEPTSGVQNAGIVFKDLSPKPSLIAYRNVIRHLAGKRFAGKGDFGKEISAYRFEEGGKTVWIVWSRREEASVSFRNLGEMRVQDMMGNAVRVSETEESVMIPASPNPIFILSSN